jgi:S-adenosylmethionine-dependent methyltransferase
MTPPERMKAMQTSWNMLKKGGIWAIGHTPNRLWYFDSHTSHLPFFHWLPDNIALEFLKHSPRKLYSQTATMKNREAAMEFLIRGGRGISYHEFALSVKEPEKLKVHSSLDGYIRKNPIRYLAWRMSDKYRYQRILRKVGPRIHQAFYEELLSFTMIKD